MTNKYKPALNNNINLIQVKLFDFDDGKINREKIISERLNKSPEIQNINKKLFLNENDVFLYVNPLCPVCKSHKIIKK